MCHHVQSTSTESKGGEAKLQRILKMFSVLSYNARWTIMAKKGIHGRIVMHALNAQWGGK